MTRINALALVLFLAGVAWCAVLDRVCVTCLESKPRGTFLSEPSLVPGSASVSSSSRLPIPDSQLPQFEYLSSTSVRGRLSSSPLAADRRETLCLVVMAEQEESELLFRRMAYKVEHEFRWLSKDVLFLVLPSSSSKTALRDFLHQYDLNATRAMPRTGPITGAIVFSFRSEGEGAAGGDVIRVHGRNGKLPNMDLINVVVQSTATGMVPNGVRTLASRHPAQLARNTALEFAHGMLVGADGLHAELLDAGIQAVTLDMSVKDGDAAVAMQKIEALVRSLSNLGERFNRSFMFYIMLHSHAFVSVDEYLWAMCLVLSPLAVHALLLPGSSSSSSLLHAYLFTTLIGLGVVHLPLAALTTLAVLPATWLKITTSTSSNSRRSVRAVALLVMSACVLPLVCVLSSREHEHDERDVTHWLAGAVLLPALAGLWW